MEKNPPCIRAIYAFEYFSLFFLVIYQYQEGYNYASNMDTAWGFFLKALGLAGVILIGGASYDAFKGVLLMSENNFNWLRSELNHMHTRMAFLAAFVFGISISYHYLENLASSPYWKAVLIVIGVVAVLTCILFFISILSTIKAIITSQTDAALSQSAVNMIGQVGTIKVAITRRSEPVIVTFGKLPDGTNGSEWQAKSRRKFKNGDKVVVVGMKKDKVLYIRPAKG